MQRSRTYPRLWKVAGAVKGWIFAEGSSRARSRSGVLWKP